MLLTVQIWPPIGAHVLHGRWAQPGVGLLHQKQHHVAALSLAVDLSARLLVQPHTEVAFGLRTARL